MTTEAKPREWAGTATLAVRAAVRGAVLDLASPQLVLVACSGGPDSTALAAAAAFVAPRAGLRAGAVIVDHGLQSGSAQVAARTAGWLTELGLSVVEVVRVEPGTGGGPEAAARQARYGALDVVADRLGAVAVLLGHTRDDQAETVLLGLARGSGARSLAGMAPVRGRYRRPLLTLSRQVVHAAVPADAPLWSDPHNADPAYARVRVRRDVLPGLEAALGPGVSAALARSADLLRADADALDSWAEQAHGALRASIASTCDSAASVVPDPAGLDLAGLAELPGAVRSRVLRREAIQAGAPSGALSAEHIAALDALITDWRGQGTPALPGGVRAQRVCGRLVLSSG